MEHLDPRIAPIFRGRPKHERLLAHLTCAMLAAAGPGVLDRALDGFEDLEVDWSRQIFVHNGQVKTLLDFNGSSAAVMRRDGYSEKQIKAVRTAFDRHEMEFPEGEVRALAEEDKPANPISAPLSATLNSMGEAGSGKGTQIDGQGADEREVDGEPTFAGHKLSELAGKSDDDLKAIEGIGAATIKNIRKAEAARSQA